MLQPKECITQWFVETQLQLRLFRQYWAKQRLADPDSFPDTARPEDWHRLFNTWRAVHATKLAAKPLRELEHVQKQQEDAS